MRYTEVYLPKAFPTLMGPCVLSESVSLLILLDIIFFLTYVYPKALTIPLGLSLSLYPGWAPFFSEFLSWFTANFSVEFIFQKTPEMNI